MDSVKEAMKELLSGKRQVDCIGEGDGNKKQRNYGGKRYHNTLLLLQHYRTIMWVMENFPEAIAEELEEPLSPVDDLLDRVEIEVACGNKKLERTLDEAGKTRKLIRRINEALTVLKNKPGDGEKLYQLIYMSYIAPEQLSHIELLYRLNLSSRHYYRLRQQAITILSICLWSAPTVEIEMWMEMLELLESKEME